MKINFDYKTTCIAILVVFGSICILSSLSTKADSEISPKYSAKTGKDLDRASKIRFNQKSLEYRDQRQKISSLNLINGLFLTEDQLKQLIPIVREASELEREIVNELDPVIHNDEYKAALDQLVGKLVLGKEADKDLIGDLMKYHGREVELFTQIDQKRMELGLKAAKVLTDEQMALVAEFKPCLIPPKNENSSLTGSASGGYGIQDGLRRLRKVPDKIWEKRKDNYLDRIIQYNEKHSPDFLDYEKEKSRIDAILNDARKLNDAEFELQVKDIADAIVLDTKVGYEHKWVARKVSEFLLMTELEDVYIAKLQQIESEKAKLIAKKEVD